MRDKDGIKEYYKTGELEWDVPLTYEDPDNLDGGVRHGVARQYWANGNIKLERTYVAGNIVGVERMFYPNGSPWSELDFVDGKKSGRHITYYTNGIIQSVAEYLDDKKHGLVQRFDQAGKKTHNVQFVNGRDVDVILREKLKRDYAAQKRQALIDARKIKADKKQRLNLNELIRRK